MQCSLQAFICIFPGWRFADFAKNELRFAKMPKLATAALKQWACYCHYLFFQNFKDNAVASGFRYQPSFNPVDKMVELYERMLQQQKEMIEKLEKLIEKK